MTKRIVIDQSYLTKEIESLIDKERRKVLDLQQIIRKKEQDEQHYRSEVEKIKVAYERELIKIKDELMKRENHVRNMQLNMMKANESKKMLYNHKLQQQQHLQYPDYYRPPKHSKPKRKRRREAVEVYSSSTDSSSEEDDNTHSSHTSERKPISKSFKNKQSKKDRYITSSKLEEEREKWLQRQNNSMSTTW